jgi:FAD:protein FMN transferase
MSASFEALGTTVTVAAVDELQTDVARDVVAAELAAVDAAYSRFRDDSELTSVNGAGGAAVHVGPILLEALRVAVAAARTTEGRVDPTVGRGLRLAGYDATYRIVAARDPASFTPHFAIAPGWQTIELDEAASTVRVPAGVELDLGATGKALAADRAAHAASDAAGCGVLVGIGGDIAVVGPPPDGGWPVAIADDHRAPITSATPVVAVASGGLATSSTAVRRWRGGTQELHHVLDPSTGRPVAGPWRTISVAAASCVDANTATTAAFILGEAGVAWLRARSLPARLCRHDGTIDYVCGWPEDAR